MKTEVENWLRALPAASLTGEAQALVTHIWRVHASLKQATKQTAPRGLNYQRKQAARLKELNLCITVPRGNGAEAMAREQEAYREKCRHELTRLAGMLSASAYGLYMPEVYRRTMSPRYAVWQLPDGSWVTPRPDRPLYSYSDLYASLSLPRVPAPFPIDLACLVMDF
jgi:hypothetical protein